jgi:class 3 adenylate cyclase
VEGLPAGAATMTVLFTDLVGSTATRSRLGDDRADALRREHDDLLSRVVVDHHGTVVKGLGDGIMAVFAAPSEGVAAAAAINQAIARRNRKAAEPLVLRMGLSVGEVRVEGDDVFGTPVVEASRLCGKAADDQVLASVWVKALAGSRAGTGFASVGQVVLKGLAEPLEVFEVEWREAGASPVLPFPDLPRVDLSMPFVGRDLDVVSLADAWARARAGRGPFVVVEGADGVGTTRLVAEVAQRQHDEATVVLYGRCDAESGAPFRPFAEALRFHLANLPDAALREHLGPGDAELIRLVPELAARVRSTPVPDPDPSAATRRLFDAVVGWLSASSRFDPILLVLDDLHLASRSTLALLGAVLQTTEPLRVLVVATASTGVDRDALDGFLAEQALGARPVERIELAGLAGPETAALVSGELGEGLDQHTAEVVAAIHEATGGVPLAVRRAVRGLLSTGQIRREVGHWAALVDPSGVQVEPLDPRRALTATSRALLELAALAGDELDPDLLGAASGLDDTTIQRAFDEGLAAGILAEHPGARRALCFAHPRFRAETVADLDPERLAEAATSLATELERQAGPARERYLAELAVAWAAAARSGPDRPSGDEPGVVDARARAIELATAAGDRARDHLAHAEAAHWYGEALADLRASGTVDDHRRFDLLLARGEAEQRAGDPSGVATLLAAARLASRQGDAAGLARAALAGRRRPDRPLVVPDPDQLSVLGATARAVGDDAADLRAGVLATLAVELMPTGDPRRRTLSAEAVELARRASDATLADALVHRVAALAGPDDLEDREAAVRELDRLAPLLDDPELRFVAAHQRAGLALEAGELAAAESAVADAREEVTRLRRAELSWLLALLESAVAVFAGELDRAAAFAEGAPSLGRRAGRPDGIAAAHPLLLVIRRWQGRLPELLDELEVEVFAQPDAGSYAPAVALALGGRLDPALAAYERAAAAGFPVGHGPSVMAGLTNLAQLAVAVGDRRGARALTGRLEPLAERHPCLGSPGPCGAHSLGLLSAAAGDLLAADRWFAKAVELHDGRGAALFAAESRISWARSRRDREPDSARLLATDAALAARARGAVGVEAAAASVLGH